MTLAKVFENRRGDTYLFEIRGTPAVAGEANPDLLDENAPDLGFRLTAFAFSSTLELEHAFCQRDEVRYGVTKG